MTCSLAASACFAKNMYLSSNFGDNVSLVGLPGGGCFSSWIISLTWTKSGEKWWEPIRASRVSCHVEAD